MNVNPSARYADIFFSPKVTELMHREMILQPGGSPSTLLAELTARLGRAEKALGENWSDTDAALATFFDYTRRGLCTLGSPLLTNIAAGRRTLGSCSAVPISTRALSTQDLDLAESYYNLNMGSGYDLTDSPDPRSTLLRLNQHAMGIENSGSCERYVGNIAHVSVHHPRVLEFINAKRGRDDVVHFNISIDVTENFMHAVRSNDRNSRSIWDAIVESAWECGDPGIISLERYNAGNALRNSAPYVTTAPCAEVGLSPGETCVFGYINLAACLRTAPGHGIDLDLVGDVAELLTRVLDDAVESSLYALPLPISGSVMSSKRKIGIGLCGLADALAWLGIVYASTESERLLADVLATVNFRSKEASLRLAERRGSFQSFEQSEYAHNPGFLGRFGKEPSVVDRAAWDTLASDISQRGLRNVMTTALPPSGRSALLLGVNPSIEPYLELPDPLVSAAPVSELLLTAPTQAQESSGMVTVCGSAASSSIFRTASEITPEEHLRLLRVASRLVDDGVSKTINLPQEATPEEVGGIFEQAWVADLKAISVYRIGSRSPRSV